MGLAEFWSAIHGCFAVPVSDFVMYNWQCIKKLFEKKVAFILKQDAFPSTPLCSLISAKSPHSDLSSITAKDKGTEELCSQLWKKIYTVPKPV